MNDNKSSNDDKLNELKAKVSSPFEEVNKTSMNALKDNEVLLNNIKQKAVINSKNAFDRMKNSTTSINPVARIFKIIVWINIALVLLGFVLYYFIIFISLPNNFLLLILIGLVVSILALIPALFTYAIGEIIDLLTEIRNSLSSNNK